MVYQMKSAYFLFSWTITFLLVTQVCSLGAQTIQEVPTTRFSMSIDGNVGVSDRLFVNDGSAPSFIENVFDDIERPDIAWEAALLTEYRINHWFGVQTGIRYTRWGYRSRKEPLIWANPSPELAEASRHQQKLTFIGVHIRCAFHLALWKPCGWPTWAGRPA